jgi:hypothetical protein
MEIDENNVPEEQDDSYVEIYSKSAIWGFSIFFSPVFGGVLLMLNLRAAGYKRAANIVLIFSIAYMLVSGIILNLVLLKYKTDPIYLNIASVVFNVAGGGILAEYFFRKYFPDNDYYPKSIANALMISILVALPLAFFLSHLKM